MSELTKWIASRRPAAPSDLAARLTTDANGADFHVALANEARARLARACARTGRVRESAFVLLEADALATYACEAALENTDPAAALRDILVVSSEG